MSETETIMRAARTILNFRGGTMSSAVQLAHDLQDAGVITPEGLRWEYAVEHEHIPGGNWHRVTEWSTDANPYQPGHRPGDDERIVRRPVGPVEVVVG